VALTYWNACEFAVLPIALHENRRWLTG